jgi:SM-20-related protein
MPQQLAVAQQPDFTFINIGKFNNTPLSTTPFDYSVVPEFVHASVFEKIVKDYPAISKSGSFPLNGLKGGAAFNELIAELESNAFRESVEKKFAVDLTGKPTMVTIRGMCSAKDGSIHTDTESKILSLLLYMNPVWEENEGGRLRLLRSKNIEDFVEEIPPASGTLLIFRRADNSFHGHKKFVGNRKVIQLNWVTEQKFADRNIKRHAISSFIKKLNPFNSGY